MKRKLVLLLLGAGICTVLAPQQRTPASFSPYVDEAGNISRPRNYRDGWTHLGSYFVMNESPRGHGIHQVYTEKRYIDAYNATGQWPDGAVIVKEVLYTAGDQLTTGAASWATEPNVWFVMVKDQQGRFPGNPLWGSGWGWALFEAASPDAQVAANYKQDCLNCHMPARKTDWVYIQGYPSIRIKTAASSP